jgi:hypothetical protein
MGGSSVVSASSPSQQTEPDLGTETAAAAAEAARVAVQPLNPATRATEGFRIAAGDTKAGSPAIRAVADAGANARTAMSRTDLPADTQKQINTVLERLGNAVIDGKIDPHMNNEFRQQLYNLATASSAQGEFREAIAHISRAAQVLDQVPLAKGTQLAFDLKSGGSTGTTKLPALDIPKLDADLYYQTKGGTSVIESIKYSAGTLAATVKDSREGQSEQLNRQSQWENKGTSDQPREARYFMLEKESFSALMDDKNLKELGSKIAAPDTRNVIIGDRAYSLNELNTLDAKGKLLADTHVAQQKAAHVNAGQPESTFKPGPAYAEFYKQTMASPDAAMKAYGIDVGQPVKDLKPLATPDIGNMKQGAAAGATGAAVIELTKLAFKGEQMTWQDLGHATTETLKGGAIGAVSAKAEQHVVAALERRVGTAVEANAAQLAFQQVGQTAATATGTGIAAKTVASRLVGSTAVGTAVTTAMSAYENRAGLAKGDSKAIGNVTADTAVGVVAVGLSSVAGAAAAGALAGSVVPGLGTAVGFGVGLAVGVGIAYGAQISGARDAIADGASKAVDWVKSWF